MKKEEDASVKFGRRLLEASKKLEKAMKGDKK